MTTLNTTTLTQENYNNLFDIITPESTAQGWRDQLGEDDKAECLLEDTDLMAEIGELIMDLRYCDDDLHFYNETAYQYAGLNLGLKRWDKAGAQVVRLLDGTPGYVSDVLLKLVAATIEVDTDCVRAWRLHTLGRHEEATAVGCVAPVHLPRLPSLEGAKALGVELYESVRSGHISYGLLMHSISAQVGLAAFDLNITLPRLSVVEAAEVRTSEAVSVPPEFQRVAEYVSAGAILEWLVWDAETRGTEIATLVEAAAEEALLNC